MLPKPEVAQNELLATEILDLLCPLYVPIPVEPTPIVVEAGSTQSESEKSTDPRQAFGKKPSRPKNFACNRCSGHFVSMKGLRQHIGKKHNLTRKYSSCPQCNKKFRTKYAVRFHVKQVHLKATRVSCSICGQDYYNKYMLKEHLAAEHPFVSPVI